MIIRSDVKPWCACNPDEFRNLRFVQVDKHGTARASDGKVAVRIPRYIAPHDEAEPMDCLEDGIMFHGSQLKNAVKAAGKPVQVAGHNITHSDGLWIVRAGNGKGATSSVLDAADESFPNIDAVMPEISRENARFVIGLDVALLKKLADVFGTTTFELRIDPNKAEDEASYTGLTAVPVGAETKGSAVIMPFKLAD